MMTFRANGIEEWHPSKTAYRIFHQWGTISMTSFTARKEVGQLLDKKKYGVLAEKLYACVHNRTESRLLDHDIVEIILMYVVDHLRFLDAFGEEGVTHVDDAGWCHSRHDEFFKVWMELGAFGLDDDVFGKR